MKKTFIYKCGALENIGTNFPLIMAMFEPFIMIAPTRIHCQDFGRNFLQQSFNKNINVLMT